MTETIHPMKRFLSLKWKALLFFSAFLLIINASFPYFAHQNLMKHFEQRREADYERLAQEFNGLMQHTVKRLQQFGGIIPSLKGMESALVTGENQKIAAAFENHWPLLQLDMGLDLVRFYSSSGTELGRWGASGQIADEEKLILKWVEDVKTKEHPMTALSCKTLCTQYVMAPVLSGGRNIGTVLVGASLAEVIVNFQQISDRDIGVIVDNTDKQASGPSSQETENRVIPLWGKKVVALTNIDLTLPLLKSISKETTPFSALADHKQVYFKEKAYELRLIPIAGLSDPGVGDMLIIDDISQNLLEIRTATRQSVMAGIIGLLLSEGLLLLILWAPMSRLKRITNTLPLLAKSAFQDVRTLVGTQKKRWMDDEIDTLSHTAITLSHQLEELETQVKKRTQSLADRMEELADEKNFIAHLLDTARVIILTQDKSGNIMMMNQYGSHLTGHTMPELMRLSFVNFLSEEDLTVDAVNNLSQMYAEEKEHLTHESLMICKNGSTKHIVWFHSRLTPAGKDSPVILSVGLDLTARKQAELQLSWLADHDPLTGLFNRRRFQTELDRILSESKRYARAGALLFFDLDQFKYVNDTRGHHAGDALLKVVASQLSRLVRSTDIIGRLGGDEFALVISETNETGALQVAQKIIEYLGDVEVPVLEHSYRVSASIGIALFPDHGATVQELLSNSDLAMYQAKEKGRSTWHLFTGREPIKTRMKEREYWRDKIKQALDHDRFIMHFQPVQEIRSGIISYYEALIRMRDQDGTLIAPGAFIPVAEQCGLIYAIDHIVLKKVITRQAELAKMGLNIAFTLNLSGYAFNDTALLPHLKQTLKTTGANPRNIVIEITETAAVSDLVAACSLMNEIKDLGCRFALDDFGTGFASFNYLKQLPVDIVKIGDTFIKEISSHPDDQIFVKSLIEVTRGLGKKTVAEGVEDAETLVLLREYAVDFAQGYHVGRPASTLREEVSEVKHS